MKELFDVKKLDYYISKSVFSKRQTPQRTVRNYEIELYATSGNVSVINGREYPQKKGNILIAKPGDTRYSIDPFECHCVHFLCDDTEIRERLEGLPKVFEASDTDGIIQIFENMLAARANADPAAKFAIQGGLLQLLGCLLTETGERYSGRYARYLSAVSDACAFMRENCDRHITLDDIAAAANLSPCFFHGVFKSVKSVTPAEYLLNIRISSAKRLLASSSLSLSEIALRCGFGSQGYFNYVFKKHTSTTPKKYRDKKRIII